MSIIGSSHKGKYVTRTKMKFQKPFAATVGFLNKQNRTFVNISKETAVKEVVISGKYKYEHGRWWLLREGIYYPITYATSEYAD